MEGWQCRRCAETRRALERSAGSARVLAALRVCDGQFLSAVRRRHDRSGLPSPFARAAGGIVPGVQAPRSPAIARSSACSSRPARCRPRSRSARSWRAHCAAHWRLRNAQNSRCDRRRRMCGTFWRTRSKGCIGSAPTGRSSGPTAPKPRCWATRSRSTSAVVSRTSTPTRPRLMTFSRAWRAMSGW